MTEHFLGSLACGVGYVSRKNLLIKDFFFLPKDFCLEQVVLQETCAGDGPA
jgi:hypothetical protein